jgi:opacity protein-like surface antigen
MKQDKNSDRVDRGWNKMHSTLDLKMPQKEKKRRGIIWLILGVSLIAVSIIILMYNDINIIDEAIDKKELSEPKKSEVVRQPSIVDSQLSSIVGENDKPIVKSENGTPKLVKSNKKNNKQKTRSGLSDIVKPENSSEIESTSQRSLSQNNNNLAQVNKQQYKNQNITKSIKDIVADESRKDYNRILTSTNASKTTTTLNSKEYFSNQISILPNKKFYLLRDSEYKISNPNNLVVEINDKNKIKAGYNKKLFISLGTDYLHMLPTIGTSISSGLVLSKNKFSLIPNVSYTITRQPYNRNSSVDELSDGEIFVTGSDTEPGGNPNNEPTLTTDNNFNNRLSYISLGLDLSYALNQKFSITGGVGRELHFGSHTFNSSFNSSAIIETIESKTIAHENLYYLSAGIDYNINHKLSMSTRYRYSNQALINIDGNTFKTSKASLSLRYML